MRAVSCLIRTWRVFGFVLQEMENAWNEYSRLERDVDWLKSALQGQMNRSDLTQVCGSVISAVCDVLISYAQTKQRVMCGSVSLQRISFKLKTLFW